MRLSDYKPYLPDGEHYVALCFDRADEKHALPLIKELYRRGIRTWYREGFSDVFDREDSSVRYVTDADLVLIIRSKDSFDSRFVKSTSLYYEDLEKRLVFIDFDVDNSDLLSSGLKLEHSVIDGNASATAVIDSLIHTPGFTHDLIGEPFEAVSSSWFKPATFAAVFIAFAAGVLVFLFGNGYIVPASSGDSISLNDKTIERGARYTIGGKYNTVLSEEGINQIETLYLDKCPESFADLKEFNNLKTVVMPQCSKEAAEYILSYGLELVLYGGAMK